MCARFIVLSDTPIAAAIAGCAIPLSRNNTIWMRWRCAAGIFHRSAVLSRRTSALLHLTICFPESDGAANHTSGNKNNQQFPPLTSKIPRFKPLWRWYKGGTSMTPQEQNRRDEWYFAFGQRLRTAREALGLTEQQSAAGAG